MANEFVAKNGLISQNNTTISGSLTVSASSGIPLQIKGGTGTLLSVSSSIGEIFKISDTFSLNLFTVSTGSIDVFNIDTTNKVVISGSLVVTESATIAGSLNVTGNATIAGLTANRALATDANDQLVSSTATATELGYLSGVTSAVQTQLDSKVYSIGFFSNAWTIAAGQTYYIANFPRNPATTANQSRVGIPKAGTITDAIFTMYTSGVTGSNNAITASIRLNNTTDYLIAQNATATIFRTFSNNSLSIPVSVGDTIEIKLQIATPYTTVPTNNFPTANILIKT
jgi:hypothetical protein